MPKTPSIVIAILAFSTSAHADAIRRRDCAPGWESRRVGHGSECFPIACTSDSQCADGRCAEVRRCYREQPISQGRRYVDPPPTAWIPQDRLCGGNDRCEPGEECRPSRECTAATRAPRRASCAVGGRDPISLGWIAAPIALVWRRLRAKAARSRNAGAIGARDRP
jgi:hypothetical protein